MKETHPFKSTPKDLGLKRENCRARNLDLQKAQGLTTKNLADFLVEKIQNMTQKGPVPKEDLLPQKKRSMWAPRENVQGLETARKIQAPKTLEKIKGF